MEDLVTGVLAGARDAAHNLEPAKTAEFAWLNNKVKLISLLNSCDRIWTSRIFHAYESI